MPKKHRHGLVIVMVLLLAACSLPRDCLIVPGTRVGEIAIKRTKASDIGIGDGSVYEKYHAQKLSIGFDQHLRVNAIEVFGQNYRTKEGIRAGDTEDAVIKEYGKAEIVDVPLMAGAIQKGTLSDRALHYHGIRFLLNKDHQITSIIVSAD